MADKRTCDQLKPFEFKPGQSGNPKGRPKGARSKLSEDFIKAMAEDFEKFGQEAICLVREEKTEVYIKVIASLLPKEMHIKVDPLEELDDAELIRRARELGESLRIFGTKPNIEDVEDTQGSESTGELPPLH